MHIHPCLYLTKEQSLSPQAPFKPTTFNPGQQFSWVCGRELCWFVRDVCGGLFCRESVGMKWGSVGAGE